MNVRMKEVVELTFEERTCLTDARALIDSIYADTVNDGSLENLTCRMLFDFSELMTKYVINEQ